MTRHTVTVRGKERVVEYELDEDEPLPERNAAPTTQDIARGDDAYERHAAGTEPPLGSSWGSYTERRREGSVLARQAFVRGCQLPVRHATEPAHHHLAEPALNFPSSDSPTAISDAAVTLGEMVRQEAIRLGADTVVVPHPAEYTSADGKHCVMVQVAFRLVGGQVVGPGG